MTSGPVIMSDNRGGGSLGWPGFGSIVLGRAYRGSQLVYSTELSHNINYLEK